MESYVSCRVASYSLKYLGGKVSGAALKRALTNPATVHKVDFIHNMTGQAFSLEDARGSRALNVRYNNDRDVAVVDIPAVMKALTKARDKRDGMDLAPTLATVDADPGNAPVIGG